MVLRDNYLQGEALSVAEARGRARSTRQVRFIRELEAAGRLDRALEFLPDDEELAARAAARRGLTRPELAVLLAYAKMSLDHELLQSDLPDAPDLTDELCGYFPTALRERFRAQIAAHPLRREIVATVVANDVVNRGGPTFVHELQAHTGRSAAEIARAYRIAREAFALPPLWAEIEALDNKVDGRVQLDLYQMVSRLIYVTSGWYLKNDAGTAPLGQRIAELQEARKALEPKLVSLLPAFSRERIEEKRHGLFKAGAPEKLAEQLALSEVAELIPDIALTARTLAPTSSRRPRRSSR